MLVVDASVAYRACAVDDGFAALAEAELVSPPLMWSEVRSALHEGVWRQEIERAAGRAAVERLETAPVERRAPRDLGSEAWRMADELGWAKTYDAEYVALASLLGCRLVTLDARLRRRTDRLGFVVGPLEL